LLEKGLSVASLYKASSFLSYSWNFSDNDSPPVERMFWV